MAGVSKGYTVRRYESRSPVFQVRFTYAGRRFAISTGATDSRQANEAAPKIFAEAISGLKQSLIDEAAAAKAGPPMGDAIAEWIVALPSLVKANTAHQYGIPSHHWLRFWSHLGAVDTASIAMWQSARLKEVARETVRKERIYLGSFLKWAVAARQIVKVPEFPPLGSAQGTRKIARRIREAIAPADVERLLAALPEWSTGTLRFRVRDFYRVLWETAWRPSTVVGLRAPEHYRPGLDHACITPDIEKSYNATRGEKFKAYKVPLSTLAREALDRCAPSHTTYTYAVGCAIVANSATKPRAIFGVHERDKYLRTAALVVLGREITEYDLKHSRITAWFSAGKDPVGISFLSGVALDTLIAHYTHPGERAARSLVE